MQSAAKKQRYYDRLLYEQIDRAFMEGKQPIVFGYSLGKGQEALKILLRGGYSVQLCAVANVTNAQAFRARAQNQLATVQVEAKIRQAGGLYRVYIGPYPARSDAERLGKRITQAFGFPTTVAAH